MTTTTTMVTMTTTGWKKSWKHRHQLKNVTTTVLPSPSTPKRLPHPRAISAMREKGEFVDGGIGVMRMGMVRRRGCITNRCRI